MTKILKISTTFTVDEEAVIPPFSSKVSKTILVSLCPKIEAMLEEKKPHKPVIVSPVFRNGQPLVKYSEKGRLELFPNASYTFYTTFIGDSMDYLINALTDIHSKKVKLYEKKVMFLDMEVELTSFSELQIEDNDSYKIQFITPALLVLPASREKYGHTRHVLYPHVFLMFYSLLRHWNAFAPKELMLLEPYRFSRYAYYNFVEVDHQIRPKTVIYDEKRRPRGFLGWAIFKRVKKKERYDRVLLKLLSYANYVGIGRSRSIGFGMVNVYPVKG